MPRKAINLIALCLLLVPIGAVAQTPKPALSYEDFAHANKGCPENSECDQIMGGLLGAWKKQLERWEAMTPGPAKLKEMQEQLRNRGWPVEFLVKSQARSGLNPVLYSSGCKEHNPKDNPTEKIWRGMGFVKGTEKEHVVFSRGDTEFKIKQGELLRLRPVAIHLEGSAPQKFLLPLDDSPAYLSRGKLWVLMESENVYVLMGIPSDGTWEVQLPPSEGLSELFDDREEVACPKGALAPEAPWYSHSHCQRLLDRDSGKTIVVQYFSTCS